MAGQTGENLKALALSLGEDTEVGQMGAKYNPETATAKETGKLFRAVMNALPGEQNKGDVQQSVALGLALTLKQLGETGNAFSIANDVLDVYQGYDLNEQQRLELANSTQGMALLNLLAAPEAASNSAQAAEKTAWSKEKKANATKSEADLQAAQQARELAPKARARRDGVSLPQATEATAAEATAAAEAQQGPQQTQQAAEAWLETAPEAPELEAPVQETQEAPAGGLAEETGEKTPARPRRRRNSRQRKRRTRKRMRSSSQS